MDPRDRADVLLSRAQTRAGVITPDNMTSPMDSANTQQIPRSVVNRIDTEPDPDSTTVLSSSTIEANDSHLAATAPTVRLDQEEEQSSSSREDEEGGLVPTVRTRPAPQSYLARRLEGL